MNKELHLFIIWKNAQKTTDKIVEDIHSKFTIKDVYDISWTSKHFSSNLSRFYGGKLPPNCPKETRIGHGPFTLIVVEDEDPSYEKRDTGRRGIQMVNTKMFDAKAVYRGWAEKLHNASDLVHATNTPLETSHDLTLLLGLNPDDYYSKLGKKLWDGEIKKLNTDLVGVNGWSDIHQLFYVLNSSIDYVVLRNFESLPDTYPLAYQEDIDLLVDNYKEACWIMNAKPVCKEPYRILNEVTIDGQEVRFDIRYVGDDYYHKQWEENILKNRVFDSGGFYKPNDEDYFYTLLYHAIVHKPEMRDDYNERLTKMSAELGINGIEKSLLDEYMNTMGYNYSKPVDKSVYYALDSVHQKKSNEPSLSNNKIKQKMRILWEAITDFKK